MLILYISEDFLNNILQRHDAAGPAELIHDDPETFLLLEKHLHELLRRHRFRYERHLADMLSPPFRRTEHLGRVDITLYMVDISLIDNNL